MKSKEVFKLRERVKQGGQCPLLAVDATPRTIYDGNGWELDPLNAGMNEPKYLAANRIHHFVPNAKAILILRNPIARTISDHRFFGNEQDADIFHHQVVNGISWWQRCVKRHSERKCAFSYHISGMSDLPPDKAWHPNGAGRLRLSLYIIYIESWLEVFARKNLLVVNSDTLNAHPVDQLEKFVFPFLELEPLSDAGRKSLNQLLLRGHLHKTTDTQPLVPHSKTLDILRDFYKPYNERLAEFTNNKAFLWT